MDIGSILLILALLVFVAAYVLRPIQDGHAHLVSSEEHQRSALMAERDRLLETLLELDGDHELGKVPEEVYTGQRKELVGRGAEVLRQLDRLAAQGEDVVSGLEDKLAKRKGAKHAISHPDDDSLEKMIAARRQARRSPRKQEAHFCPNCGEKLMAGDRFCPQCGKAVS